ncbi:hypothetical protein ACERII_24460 [Evansella sp. AB-rgal1]|uniref:hypothetical protein n=1 Tax=Evansella sp. AB-rgal1 TaxID=3242696 RepID=UPI00359E0EBF
MDLKMIAYFRTENDAESAAASLQKLNVTDVLVDEVPSDNKRGLVLIPAVNTGNTATGNHGPTNLVAPGYLKDESTEDSMDTMDPHITHVLEFHIPEEEIDSALKELRQADAMLDKTMLEDYKIH